MGYKINEVWDMTYGELKETVEPILEKQKEILKVEATMIYQQAQLIGIAFNEPKKFPKNIYEVFPSLFDKPKTIEMPDFLREKAIKRGAI